MENKIYKEAILDAKALRASAIANAKSMMQEAIEPAIQEMMRLKLSEELEEEIEEEDGLEYTYDEGYGHKEEGYHEEGGPEEGADYGVEEAADEDVTEATLEEILAELDALEEEETLNEAEEDETEEDEEETEEDEEEVETEEAVDDDTKVVQLTLGDLKAALFPQMGGEEAGEDLGDMEAGDEEATVSLDEILAELEAKEEGETHKDTVKEAGVMSDPNFIAGLAALLGTTLPIATSIYKSMKGKSSEEKKQIAAQMAGGIAKATSGQMEEELEIAKETIETLRESINEINLLNAKLLYMNKIFKAKNLTESQKVKVVKAFDRGASVKEVKNTYEVLKESIETRKSQLKESVGFASKPIGSVAKNNIIEADPFINRWQKIAGIK